MHHSTTTTTPTVTNNSNIRRKHGNKNRAPNSIYLENRLLSTNSGDNFVAATDYQFSYSVATEKTEMSIGEQSNRSLSLRFGAETEVIRLPFWQRFKKNCDCFLFGTTFSQSIVEKRKAAVCCGTVRACCLNAETGNVNFRPLGIRKKPPSGSPLWRRQLRSRIFVTSLAIVTTHFLLWLPYNLLNTLRFIHHPTHEWLQDRGANLLEDLIVLNSVLNPILYAYEQK
uniref:G-protein coupled receptors family 1 profile domain-containing protein n=1 Tax=Panagrolaimus superbus TaxID=310955 RepID=A0A914YDL7_9BILA